MKIYYSPVELWSEESCDGCFRLRRNTTGSTHCMGNKGKKLHYDGETVCRPVWCPLKTLSQLVEPALPLLSVFTKENMR